MTDLARTPLYDRHQQLKAKLVDFGGWEMPLFYPDGIVTEHLATRRGAGLFDVSHMGRFIIKGVSALAFLQHALTNNAAALDVGQSQYTIIADENGGAVDDAYLYRFVEGEYLLVVNAANREKDWAHFQELLPRFDDVSLEDRTAELAMISLQGPESRRILSGLIEQGGLPEPLRNHLGRARLVSTEALLARTGYTGEPLCFELFLPAGSAGPVWDALLDQGAKPIGLGARDTLRLEAGLPLYGHEFGLAPDGAVIPILACPVARFAVSFSPLKGDYVGRAALLRQFEALKAIAHRDYSLIQDLPRVIRPLAMTGRGVGRAGSLVQKDGREAGFVTSGTTVPYWVYEGEGLEAKVTDEHKIRAIGLALVDSRVIEGDRVDVQVRKKLVAAEIVPHHLRSEAPPHARPIIHEPEAGPEPLDDADYETKAAALLRKAIDNHHWRQDECINLIPSEMTQSRAARMLSILDPSFRYAEHRKTRAFRDAEVFYYQGADFIAQVEALLIGEMKAYLGCPQVETRVVSGQMANTAVFSALLDYINRLDRKSEPRRLRMVLNQHIGKGGHLSAQPMGALRDFVARDPRTERPAVVNFPVLDHDRYRVDVPKTLETIAEHRPEFIIFGKSMVIYREPVGEIRRFLDREKIEAVVMYDMAHVLGLIGPHFQQPFIEGADVVTGSTHKTFFGTQRGVIGGNFDPAEERYELWEALERRTFPGSVSNHHLGTLLGLLMAAYEMNHFKDTYQPLVLENARAFASALAENGLDVAGDREAGFTETHQVIVHVPYAKGPELAKRLEENNIICNYQASPDEEGFTASGALRLGAAEMTRMGMQPEDFQALARLMAEIILHDKDNREPVKELKQKFREPRFQLRSGEIDGLMEELHRLL